MDVQRLRFSAMFAALTLSILGLAASAGPQDAVPSPVTVAVRVRDAGRFVAGLTLSDFEISEDGVPQRLQALYQVDKNAIVREEGEAAAVRPAVARRFHLLFQMYDYDPKISQALDYFFSSVLLPGDSLEIYTPVNSYQLTAQAFARKPKDVLARETKDLVRKDINKGNFVYKGLLKDLRRLVQGIQRSNPMIVPGDDAEGGMVSAFSMEQIMDQYRDSLAKLEALQRLDPDKIVGFAQAMKKQPGRKVLILFYQQEYRPELNPRELNTLIDNNQDNQSILADLHELFQVHHRAIPMDVDRIAQAYCDSGADVGFLFMRRTPEKFGGVTMREESEDVFKLFFRIAEATGGFAGTTQNPQAELKGAVEAMEACYLLAYTPGPAAKAGSFRRIAVAIKGKPFRISCGQGYFAR
ncbi:MAG TPA: hypothetical protein P5119_04395 [Candidatus Aminicenantes bacterium]|nr:hypothetical protein [Candidatus Aminicenantes bacterium]HRY64564.1 hypothetical protein [Candidatus Aminicenantes bacterium]HRZ71477.1 hypothetical protein [Candidatus Aminicenantes bacterium]